MAETGSGGPAAVITNGALRLEFDKNLRGRLLDGRRGGEAAEYLCGLSARTERGEIDAFPFESLSRRAVRDGCGEGEEHRLRGRAGELEAELAVRVYPELPDLALLSAAFTNRGGEALAVRGATPLRLAFPAARPGAEPVCWSFQGASYESRPDWVLPVHDGFSRRNYLGMNAADYGGGIPLTDFWDAERGVALGHCELSPRWVSLPVEASGGTARASVREDAGALLAPGETLRTVQTFLLVHEGDYFCALRAFRRLMERRGMRFAPLNPEAYEPAWCAWGYERDFTFDQIFGALPKVKELGFRWVCLDDGWQTEEGDLTLDPVKFPHGDEDMRAFVRRIHGEGFKIQLWWIPMACDPKSEWLAAHPESLILDEKGQPCMVTWWDNRYLCPAYGPVIERTRRTVRKILGDWGFDGLKIDGQHLNAAPPCHNPAHRHARPEDSSDAVPGFFRMIYEEAARVRPDALIMFCPCGTCCSFYTLPYFNMPVASDPESSWQVRLRAKAYKALLGGDVPYNADHLELSDGGEDFASAVGTGSVLNTKFTWPAGSGPARSVSDPGACFDLTPRKEAAFRKWLGIYREKLLPRGDYRGELYRLGVDFPECHAVEKDGVLHYAFYAERFDGETELRGLAPGHYRVVDYVAGREIARLAPGESRIPLRFEKYALLAAEPLRPRG